jgi:hypothetical protein
MTGSWTTAGDLPVPTQWQGNFEGPVVLADGKLLQAGGSDAHSASVAATAVFDPSTGRWTASGPLSETRRLHTLTRLADGRVLAAAGASGPVRIPVPGLATAELYDPAVGVWKSTGGLATGRSGHSATLLADGRVLVAGGDAPRTAGVSGTLRSAELYDQATGTWSTTGAMTDARWGHQAVALADGRVLVIGGIVSGADSGLAFCEVYNPATGVWTPTGSMSTPRRACQATLLADGAVLVTGGVNNGMANGWMYANHSHRSAEIYDPTAGVWRPAPPMPTARAYHRAVRLATGSVLVIGGTDTATLDAGYRNAVLFDPSTEQWTPAAGLATGRWALGAVELVDGRVLAFGGVTRSNHATPRGQVLVASTEVYTP